MPKSRRDTRLYELAKLGAEARLSDLLHEIRLLVDLFPHLGDAFDADELPISFIVSSDGRLAAAKGPRRDRRKASAIRRKALP